MMTRHGASPCLNRLEPLRAERALRRHAPRFGMARSAPELRFQASISFERAGKVCSNDRVSRADAAKKSRHSRSPCSWRRGAAGLYVAHDPHSKSSALRLRFRRVRHMPKIPLVGRRQTFFERNFRLPSQHANPA